MDGVAKRRILFITDAWRPQINGVVRTYEYLSAELEKLGHTVRVIGPCDFPCRMPMPGYHEITLALFPYRHLARMIAEYKPDSIHIATEGPLGYAARRYCIRNKIKFNTAYHSQFPMYVSLRAAKVHKSLEKPFYNFTDNMIRRFHAAGAAIITTTPTMDNELRARGYETPMFQMVRGTPVDSFSPGASTVLDQLKRPIALYVGRVAIEKNLEAFLGMKWEGSKVVVGGGPDFDMLKAKYPDSMFTGPRTGSELAAHYRAADVFVFPSLTDTFGIVLIEALACGLPVAAYDVTGPRDIITNERLGALSKDNLAEAASRALKAPGEKQERYKYVCDHYTWPVAARRFLEILEKTGT